VKKGKNLNKSTADLCWPFLVPLSESERYRPEKLRISSWDLSRIDKLQPTSQRYWGKMDVAQMLAHCSAGIDMA
jgi:hypothetical protein